MTQADINRRLNATPFRPFRIHLSDGTTLPVSNPRPFLLGRTAAVVPAHAGAGWPLLTDGSARVEGDFSGNWCLWRLNWGRCAAYWNQYGTDWSP